MASTLLNSSPFAMNSLQSALYLSIFFMILHMARICCDVFEVISYNEGIRVWVQSILVDVLLHHGIWI